MTRLIDALGVLTSLCVSLTAQSASLAHDINPGTQPISSSPEAVRSLQGTITPGDGFLRCGNQWFFTAETTIAGRELWRTDGTAIGTRLVKDIYPGSVSASISSLHCHAGKVFFAANDGVHGIELWCSDGTAAGTQMVLDIYPGSNSGPNWLTSLGSRILFAATDGPSGLELWSTDGTAAGTARLKDLLPGPVSSHPYGLLTNNAGTWVVFVANTALGEKRLWRSDGTGAGTIQLSTVSPGNSVLVSAQHRNVGSWVVFPGDDGIRGRELWRTDGTPGGTVLVKDLQPGASDSRLGLASGAVFGGFLYFSADDGILGSELWRTDGTTAGTTMVADIATGSLDSTPHSMFATGSELYFSAKNPATGQELWSWNGTSVRMIRDLWTGVDSSFPKNFQTLGTRVLFTAQTATPAVGNELFITDGTSAGTLPLKDINPGLWGSRPSDLTILSPTEVMFRATNDRSGGPGNELFVTDGTTAGTKLLKDIEPSFVQESSNPQAFQSADGTTMYFAADDGHHGSELWRTDASGASMVKDLIPGPSGARPKQFTTFWNGTRLVTVFTAVDFPTSNELWVTDDTPGGTGLLKDINPGGQPSNPEYFTAFQNRLYFSAYTHTHGGELWVTDGTTNGTVLVHDLNPGAASSFPSEFTPYRGKLYFLATKSGAGTELWVTDGSSSGTSMVIDLNPGPGSGVGYYLIATASGLVFAGERFLGSELFTSDGTAGGTRLVKDIFPGVLSSRPAGFMRCGSDLFFRANDGVHGNELWKTDLTTAGTVLVADVYPGTGTSAPIALTCFRGKLIFTAQTATLGRELFVSDGTAAGTKMLGDVHPGHGASSSPYGMPFVHAHGQVLFYPTITNAAGDSLQTIYATDGTVAGTKPYLALPPISQPLTEPKQLIVSNGVVYFAGDDGPKGVELYRIDGTPGTVEVLGTECGTLRPQLASTNWLIGNPVTVSGYRATAGAGLLLFGAATTPFSISGLVAPGCPVWIDLNGVILRNQPAGPSWNMPLTIPNSTALVGLALRMQSAYDPLPLTLSNGLQVVVGQ